MSPWFLVTVALAIVAVALACALADLRKEHQALQAKYREAMRILSVPSRRDVSQREFYDCLDQLGFRSLEEYRTSEWWQATKRRYRRSDYPQRCLICGCPDFDLHHRTYARLGEEELFDLVPLCREHHDRLHELLDPDPALCVKDTHDYLVRLIDRQGADEPDKQAVVEGPVAETKQQRSRAGKPWTAKEDVDMPIICTPEELMGA